MLCIILQPKIPADPGYHSWSDDSPLWGHLCYNVMMVNLNQEMDKSSYTGFLWGLDTIANQLHCIVLFDVIPHKNNELIAGSANLRTYFDKTHTDGVLSFITFIWKNNVLNQGPISII